MKKLKKENKGFSLVELIVVVLILGILAVAVTPQIMNWIDKSKDNKDLSYAGSVATAVESVALEYYGVAGELKECTYYIDVDGVSTEKEENLAASNAVTKQEVKSLCEEISNVVVKFQNPENTDNKSFEISVKLNGSAVEVTCKPSKTPAPDVKKD